MSLTVFPKQNIPDSEKTKKWCEDNIRAMLGYQTYTNKYNRERKKDYENYLLYNGVFDVKQFEYVTNTYGVSSPARLVNYPIIAPKIDIIVGEFVSQPLSFDVQAISRDALTSKLETKVGIVAEKVLKEARKEIQEELGIELEEEEFGVDIPDDIEKFIGMNYREQVEDITFNGLRHLVHKYNLKNLFKQGLYDMCITSKEFYRIEVRNGDPYVRRVDPRALLYDVDNESETLQNSNWVAEERFLTVNEILDEFGNQLSQIEVSQLEEIRQSGADAWNRYNKPYQWYFKEDANTPLRIRVVTAEWKSLRTLKYKLSVNKFDPENPFKKRVKDTYKPKKGEKLEKRTTTDIWTATQIGHEILVNCRRLPNQIRKEDNYAYSPLSYVGVIKNNIDGITLSVVDALKNIQLLYNIVMYHMELALARSGGKAIVYDTSQKPNGLSFDDVIYHAKNSGVIPINSKQEGNQVSSFNQFSQIDFTLSNSVQQLINLKIMLEQTAEKVTGITGAREGFTKTDAVGVNERNVLQSSLITQPLVSLHSQVIEMVFQQLADQMPVAWNDGKKISYVLGDYTGKFFEVTEDIRKHEVGVYVMNTNKNKQDKEAIMQFAQASMQSGSTSILDVLKIYNSESANQAEHILESGIKAVQEEQARMAEQQQQAQQQAQEAQGQQAQAETQMKQQDIQSKVEVAKINADALLKSTQMKIDGTQETQDFSQKHQADMSMLNTSNKIEEQQQQQEAMKEKDGNI